MDGDVPTEIESAKDRAHLQSTLLYLIRTTDSITFHPSHRAEGVILDDQLSFLDHKTCAPRPHRLQNIT